MLSSLTSGNDEDELQPEYDISDDEQESPDEKDSDSDDDAENKDAKPSSQAAHSKLMKAISSLDGKKRSKVKQRSEPTLEVSEFHLNKATDERGVKVHELVRTLKNTAGHSDIRKQLNNFQKKNPTLKTPLYKHEAEKIQRTLAYNTTSKEVSKWDEVVKGNRNAEHLSFPLNQSTVRLETVNKFVRSFKVTTPLEQQVYKLLKGSKHNENRTKALTKAEEDALSAMSLQEARVRRAELQKHRALLSYYEAKCRRQSKIKSKKYHRIQRKSKAKEESKKLAVMMERNPEEAEELLMKIDRSRAEERMSLKHKNTGKWAKGQIRFGKYNKEAREQLQEQLQQNQDLTKKIAAANRDDDEDESVGNQSDEDEMSGAPNPALTDINNPWFDPSAAKSSKKRKGGKTPDEDDRVAYTALQPVVAENKDDVDVPSGSDSDEDEDEILKTKMSVFKNSDIDDLIDGMNQQESNRTKNDGGSDPEDDIADDDDDDDDKEGGLIAGSLERRQTLEKLNEDWLSDEDEASKPKKRKNPVADGVVGGDDEDKATNKPEHIDPNKVFTIQPKTMDSMIPDMMDDEEEGDLTEEQQQRMNIQQAFADDDVVEEFQKEKEDKMEKDRPKAVDLTVPGWGDWAGVGVEPSKKKKKVIPAPLAKPRKDNKLHHVIINENRDKKVAMHLVNDLPRNFKHAHQFQRSIRTPIGSHWNTALTVKKLTVPKITTKVGAIIEPINAADVFDDKKKKLDIKDGGGSKGGNKRQPDIMLDDGGPQRKKNRKRKSGGGGQSKSNKKNTK